MPWTTPITWADDVVYDQDDLNAQIRDNQLVLKISRANDGKVGSIDAARFADLSAANLTGLAKPGVANTYTNRGDFTSATLRVPVGADAGLSGGAGSLWVEGDYLHWLDDVGDEWRYLGTQVATSSPGVPGSLWVESADVHYVDASDVERRVIGTFSGFHSDAAARKGSVWMEEYLHWIREAGALEYQGHADSHTDSSHTDSHTDSAHSDTHSDSAHADSHSDTHSDVAHSDTHGDFHNDHSDDFHQDTHTDTHGDVAHSDTHSDTHSDDAHVDTHSDQEHDDVHGDAGHTDVHSDRPEAV